MTYSVAMMSSNSSGASALQLVQRRRKRILWGIVGVTWLPMLFVGSHWWPDTKALYKTIEWIGIVAIFVCIFGRTWCTLYIGGRKKRELVTLGPYSICRNPLYAFTTLGAFGIGAQSGSIVVAMFVAIATFVVFRDVMQREETFLGEAFGDNFTNYAGRVPRFLPRFSTWKDANQLTINPQLVVRTFLDATLFLLSIPAADVLETLQRNGMLPIWLRLF